MRTFAQWLRQPVVPAELGQTDRQLPVLIVGAGPAGLAAMTAMKCAGIPFEAVESHNGVGGIWDQANPLSTVYDSLSTNTSRYTTHLGTPMPSAWPAYPHHRAAHDYLMRFAEQHGLLPRIRFRTKFQGASKSERDTWIARFRSADGKQIRTAEFRAIMVATGLNNKTNRVWPEAIRQQAEADGLHVIHSSCYRNPAAYAGKRVLVVGTGVSGTEIANEVSRLARRTFLSLRTAPWIVPANVLGQPGDLAAVGPTACVPFWIYRRVFRVICGLTIGHPRRLGLPAPAYRLLDRFAITDRGIVQALKEKRVHVRSNVARIEDGAASFTDPREKPEAIDAVIFATGYARRYPLMETSESADGSLTDSLPFLIFHRTEPGIVFMAEPVAVAGGWPIFVEQARAVAAYFSAEGRGGRNVRAFNARRALPSPDFKRHWYSEADRFHLNAQTYIRSLRKLASWLSD